MKFYTHVACRGNYIYYRGVDNGRRVRLKKEYSPTLFVPSHSPLSTTWKDLQGNAVDTLNFSSVYEAREYLQKYEDVDGFTIYGNSNFQYTFISDQHQEENIDWNISDVVVAYIDIEVGTEHGMPTIERCENPITAITIKLSTRSYYDVFACGEYVPHRGDIKYHQCTDEHDLIEQFLEFWKMEYPDVITGWNCIPLTSNIWGSASILKLKDVFRGQYLHDSRVETVFPTSTKIVNKVTLENGIELLSSQDHIFPYVKLGNGRFSSLQFGPKEIARWCEGSVNDMKKDMITSSIYLEVKTRTNSNPDYPIDDDVLYCLGAIFTDGSITKDGKVMSFYQNDNGMFKFMLDFFNRQKRHILKSNGIWSGKGRRSKNKRIRSYLTKYNKLTPYINWVYDSSFNKKLSIELLSNLSIRQFLVFLGGCIDGDGGIWDDQSIGLCNYDGNLTTIEELLRWNGVFSIIGSVGNNNIPTRLRIPYTVQNCSVISNLSLKIEDKANKLKELIPFDEKSSSSDDISWRKSKHGYLVRISDIKTTHDEVPMCDIETNTNYFWYSGVRTHNCKTFDIPYIVGRICSLPLFGEEKARWLSPWGKITLKSEQFYGKDQRVFELLGISTLDYMQLFRKYAANYSQESYKLDHIAHVELKERKLDYSEYDNLHDLYRKNFQKFIEYNIRDVELVEKLNAKGRLIDMALTLAYDNKTNYEDVFSQVRMWDVICYNHLRKKKIVIPPKKSHTKNQAYEGAYVKDPQMGRHRWVASFDLNSLYPHLIMQYNLSPEMLIEPRDYTDVMRTLLDQKITVDAFLEKRLDLSVLDGCTITPNGQLFRTSQHGFLAEIMQTMYDARVIYKRKQIEAQKEKENCTDPSRKKELENLISRYKNLQLAKKVGLNSAYGAMGNEYFRFFDVRIAEAVTLAGQLSIRWIEKKLNEFMNTTLKTTGRDYVLASDTDSIYLNLGPLVRGVFGDKTQDTAQIIEWMDKACEKINQFIDKSYKELAEYVHAYQQKMQMKRESLVDTAIWTAKKRYILNVWDQEGVRYKEPDLKIQGLEAIKSSTPSACRDKIKEAIKIIMTGTEDDVITFIDKFRVDFKALPLGDIAFPRTANGLEEYHDQHNIYTKGTPMHVKAALVYNHFLREHNLSVDYELIRSGEKIKFIALQTPNILGSPVVAFGTRIPKELKLETMVDYRVQFEKSFIEPLRIVLDKIGWHTEPVSTLEGFFG